MIVDPDFPDHWKTRMLVDLLDGDESGVACILRLWAHCQNRRTHIFPKISPQALKAICRFPGHANKLESSLLASGFVRREGENLIIHEWDRYNASLLANWENGKKGGRPPKPPPRKNPRKTHGFQRVNPSLTDSVDSMDGVDRVDSSDRDHPKNPPASAVADWTGLPDSLRSEEFQRAWTDYIAYRRERKLAKLGDRSIAEQWREMQQWGSPAAIAAIRETIRQGWQGVFLKGGNHKSGPSRGIEIPPHERPPVEVYR